MPKSPKDRPIRMLHTADWHLGREFHGADLTEAHQHFFDWLVEQITERDIDLVLMAGDIHDRALPPVKAVELLNRNLGRLGDLVPTILIAGNHDSIARMGHGDLLRKGLTLRSGTDSIGTPVIYDEGDFPLAIYPIPYLGPLESRDALNAPEATHESVLNAAVERCRDNLDEQPEGTRAVTIAHAFITGAETSDSERGIRVGGSDSVPASVFDGFDYVALGHLHRPQEIEPGIRYAGSPLYLSYSEIGKISSSDEEPKSVSIIELGSDGKVSIEPVPIPSGFRVSRIEGTMDELLDPETHLDQTDDWLEITITGDERPHAPKEKLDRKFSRVLSLKFSGALTKTTSDETRRLAEMAQKAPLELVDEFITHVRDRKLDEDETKLVEQALASGTATEIES